MYCQSCGALLADSAAFCQACGKPVAGRPTTTAPAAATAAVAGVVLAPGMTYAGFWSRLLAWVIDTVACAIVALFVLVIIAGILSALSAAGDPGGISQDDIDTLLGFSLVGVYLLGRWLYSSLMESSRWEATLGKMALGLIVTDTEGRPISFGRATGRDLLKFISGVILGIGFLMAGFTEKKQALHDMIANCLVVKRS